MSLTVPVRPDWLDMISLRVVTKHWNDMPLAALGHLAAQDLDCASSFIEEVG